ncbi:MAG: 2-amino-4-hydroxy-6-hydroxymethyldihydropteridine diphosphokinase [Acidobacteria bacterium]|nr:2-amino-4-hydroxy-6-hydroxymethyldihydropteridine diphosphokinase [Acidobacteriota bacterium]
MGSNLGERCEHLEYAVESLRLDLSEIKVSTFLETQPVGVGEEHGPYLNGALAGRTQLSPRDLLERLLEIETERGRSRPYPKAPRTLDLDLILYGDVVRSESGLQLPHPHFRDREFVLAPLGEIAADMIDPVTGKTVAALFVAKRNNRI